MEREPAFLITIDTEGDDLWALHKPTTTENASYLPRFQALCQKYGFKPTYLTDYEMANSAELRQLGREIIRDGTGEIGMHLHAWNSPPEYSLTEDDERYHPYLTDYPEKVMRDKIKVMTDLLEDTFGIKMMSHRGGRWAFNEAYARILVEHGYRIDCSVTPHVSWRDTPGDPKGAGGPDYTHFPDTAYFVNPEDISRPGDSALLEVPVSITPCTIGPINRMRPIFGNLRPTRRAFRILFPPATWLRPGYSSLSRMLGLVKSAVKQGRDYIEFMLHSSEFMPGGSPTFPSAEHIERLYGELEGLFETASRYFKGYTLAEYYQAFTSHERG